MSIVSKKKKLCVVALSGGVDSAVAAFLLKKKYDLIGVFLHCFEGEGCKSGEDQRDAQKVANALDIPLYTFNFIDEYKKYVFDYMVKGYADGDTPNPDVMCNKEIKFGVLWNKAHELGAERLATGHYIRKMTARSDSNRNAPPYRFFEAKDAAKDQSYFLCAVPKEILWKSEFPLGNLLKSEVREIARKNKLPVAQKKDSQGICFVGKVQFQKFLEKYIASKKGDIIDSATHKKIGEHRGSMFYTIGQRHGLNIGGSASPYYIAGKDNKKNIVYVARENDQALYGQRFIVAEMNWLRKITFPLACDVRTRYHQEPTRGTVKKKNIFLHEVSLEKPVRAVTVGQYAVFYHKKEMLGGGRIIVNN